MLCVLFSKKYLFSFWTLIFRLDWKGWRWRGHKCLGR